MIDHRHPDAAPVTTGDATIEIDLGAPDFADRSFDHFARLRAACPIHRALFTDRAGENGQFGAFVGHPLWATTGYDATSAALLDDRFGVDLYALQPPEALPPVARTREFQIFSRNLLALDPPAHTRLRKLVQPSFTQSAIAAWAPRIQRIADDLLDAAERAAVDRGEIAPDRSIELIAAFAFPLPITVIFELLGVPLADRERIGAMTETLLVASPGDEAMAATLRPFIDYAAELVAAKRRRPAGDLLSQLIAAEADGDRLSEDELLSMILLLILAGHVTTVNLIGNGVFALLTHPAERAKLAANPESIGGAVEETLRFWGPVEVASERYAKADVEFAGAEIAQSDMVLPILAAANRDPARFPDPDRFDITRPDAHRHIAFGKGIHACLGAPLARLEGRIALGTLFGRYPELRLDAEPDALVWRSAVLRSLGRLPVRF
ncbi:MAG TPA: cytochrome P450 [Thermomicrobiales bacterium]|nr:cytochrome P450 [Thermomicrobiales bacterium]